MSETQWPHTLHILLNQKNKIVWFPKPECLNFFYNNYISNFGCSNFYWLVPNG
jgi:hypothetical protein